MKTICQINETIGCHVTDPPQRHLKIYVVNCFWAKSNNNFMCPDKILEIFDKENLLGQHGLQ